jgi:hypothetical protein
LKTANKVRSIEVQSEKTPIGLVPCDFEKAQLHGIGGSDGSALGPGLCSANR